MTWLKNKLPHGLYGRAALILLLPVATLQLALSIDFAQRYFRDVTEQLTRNTLPALVYVIDLVEQDRIADAQATGQALGVRLERLHGTALTQAPTRQWYDLSGRTVERVLRSEMDSVVAVGFIAPRTVSVVVETSSGLVSLRFSRRQVSPVNPHQFFVATLVIAALMAVIAGVFLRNQLRPIARLAAAAEAFGRGEHLPYRVGGAREVRAAGRAFLAMRARIERNIVQRTTMLSGISHDLRTPLTRLRLEAEMLDPQTAAPIIRDLDEMGGLVDSFLAFARGEAEPARPIEVDLAELLGEVVADAARTGHPIAYHGQASGVILTLRPLAIRRAVQNLIGNAVRYGSSVELSLTLAGAWAEVRVDDDGPGIKEADRARALAAFERLDQARNQDDHGGAGLGLAITADIARRHGGTLVLGVSHLGGLSATLRLPNSAGPRLGLKS